MIWKPSICLSLLTLLLAAPHGKAAGPGEPKPLPVDDGNPFGISSSSEWSGAYPRFEPLIHNAGVGWIRYWCEWNGMQRKPGEWKWKWADDFVATSRANGLRVAGVLAYFAPWASSAPDGTKDYGAATRTFPVRDPQYWKDYVGGVVGRYHNDVKHWEVWNEVNSPTFNRKGTLEDYANLVRWAYESAKAIDKKTQIGIGVANFGLAYLDQAIKAGAADHFDYLCVHPYENAEGLLKPDGEIGFLSLARNLRKMLAANHQNKDMPLWMTEIGLQSSVKPDTENDARQADVITKVYALSIAQGFDRVVWFEARGPAYGKGTDHGLLREDWSPRPAYEALSVMVATLGQEPHYLGWLDLQGGYGFVFRSAHGPVLVAWMPLGQLGLVTFDGPVDRIDLDGKSTVLAAGESLKLTDTPVFAVGIPELLAQAAAANKDRPFPWGGDYSKASQVSCNFSSPLDQRGVRLIDRSLVETAQGQTYGIIDAAKKGEIHFGVHPSFASYGTRDLDIKVIARRDRPDQPAAFRLRYETLSGRHGYAQSDVWELPADDQWHERTWHLSDANFVNTWAYNIAICGLSGRAQVREISVLKRESSR